MARHQTIECDRCRQTGKTDNQYQEGWHHMQVFSVINNSPKDIGSYDLCYNCIKEWDAFVKGYNKV